MHCYHRVKDRKVIYRNLFSFFWTAVIFFRTVGHFTVMHAWTRCWRWLCFRYKFVLHYVNQVILMQQSKGDLYQNKVTYRQPQEKLRLTKKIWINYDSTTGLTAYQNRHNIAKKNWNKRLYWWSIRYIHFLNLWIRDAKLVLCSKSPESTSTGLGKVEQSSQGRKAV